MPLRKMISLMFLILSAICLVVGFAGVLSWIALIVGLINLVIWLFAFRGALPWLPTAALAVSVGSCAAGLLIGASTMLMMISVTLSLAVWDLLLLDFALTNSSLEKGVALFEQRHYESLALALGSGLIAAVAGRAFHLQIPFGILVLLVVLAFLSLDRLWRLLNA